MSIFDKLKNALFEEEYVEVDEKPKAKPKKEKIRPKRNVSERENIEKPIAKKIVLPEKKENFSTRLEDDPLDNDIDIESKEQELDSSDILVKNNDFKVMDFDDFKPEEEVPPSQPEIVKVIEKEPVADNLYQGSRSSQAVKKPYGIEESPKISVHEYGAYEKKDDRGYFKPSPIISPIYGILDKNYRKEEIVTKKEVRLTSSYAREKLNVDEVRKKAYGPLEDKQQEKLSDDFKEESLTFDVEDDDLLVDLTSEKAKPSVKDVTMGDALEYFQDLGLEYNVDYVDAAKKTKVRRTKDNYENNSGDTLDDDDFVSERVKPRQDDCDDLEKIKASSEESDDDNLFDLIDSMYKEED